MKLPLELDASPAGFRFYPGHFDRDGQVELLAAVRAVLQAASLFTPRMPKSGRPFSVRMSNCGPLGWVSDERGYRYQFSHPETCVPWPVELSGFGGPARSLPDQLLWSPHAKMGLHQDRDELEFDAPVISISLGNSCLFRLGGRTRSEPTRSIRLSSGDVLVPRRHVAACLSRCRSDLPSTSVLLPQGGRINLTLRRVTRSAPPAGAVGMPPVGARSENTR